MKKIKSIHAGLIAAVLLASVSTGAYAWVEQMAFADTGLSNIGYFFKCTIFRMCAA